jgi:hypothetical protein
VIARVARFTSQPQRFTSGEYRWVLETIREVAGFRAAFHFVDESSGDSISVSVFETEDAARSAEQAVGAAREKLGKEASPPDEVRTWRVVDRAP